MSQQKKYGLIGRKLIHSFSKKYFTHKFEVQKVNADYLNFELKDVGEINKVFKTKNLSGLNVTIPYKEAVIQYLDNLSVEAKEVGAVNTIQFKDGQKIGHNTDVFGFRQMIKPFFKSHHERSMILGTGGAAKAAAHVLEKLGSDVIFISRNPQKDNEFGYDDINQNMINFMGVIVNTTPVGTFPDVDQYPDIPYNYISDRHLVIDLIYNPEETVFLRKAKEQGATILNGKTMLEQQAEKSWEIWNE